MTVLWRCPACDRAIRLSVPAAEYETVGPGHYKATVDTSNLELAVRVHERSHR